MKRLTLLLFLLGSLIVKACPPPTGHLVVDIQAMWNPIEYNMYSEPSLNGTGAQFAIGYEIPKRAYKVYASGQYRYGNKWSVGLLQKVELLPLFSGSPIVPEFTLNVGYDYRNCAYLRPGIELSFGRPGSFAKFLIRYEAGGIFSNRNSAFDHNLMVGLEFWIGKCW